ncbi:MAG: histidine kinase dimerization/phospho-acceptor domain-containing protein [Candidatus Eisenbacteria bacterium]
MPPRSLRARLLLGIAAALLAVFSAAGLTLDQGVRRSVQEQVDRELRGKAILLASAVEVTKTGLDVSFADLDMREFETDADPSLLVITSSAGESLYRSPSAESLEVHARDTQGSLDLSSLDLAGHRLRAVEVSFAPRLDLTDEDDLPVGLADSAAIAQSLRIPWIHLFLARDIASVDHLLARLRLALILIGGAAALVALVLMGTVIGRSLQPVDELTKQIAGLDEAHLAKRVEVRHAPQELGPVIDQLNNLLAQLEAAFERERTFSADIAHELRTPLAGLQTTLEVTLARDRPPEEYREALHDALGIVGQLRHLILRLLELARLEAGLVPVSEERIDLRDSLTATWRHLEKCARERRLDVVWELGSDTFVLTDRALVESAIRNILDNAVAHVPPDGRVEIAIRGPDSGALLHLRVASSGSTVPAETVPILLDRLTRRDPARNASEGHAGLGLAIVRRIAEAIGAPLSVTSELGGDFVVDLALRTRR